jgi:hypothetical protein
VAGTISEVRGGVSLVLVIAVVGCLGAGVAGAVAWPQAGTVTVGSGRWGAHAWALGVNETGWPSYCVSVALDARVTAGSCGTTAHFPGIRLGETAGTADAQPSLHGPVVASARVVVLTLSDRATIRARVLAPPRGLMPSLAFFAAPVPCGAARASVVAVAARDARGQIVVRRTLPAPLPLATC